MEDIQNYLNQEVGVVQNVDTKKVSVSVEKEEILNRLKINDIVVLSGKAISLLGEILANGNQNAITDIGVGTMLLMVGLEGGILNVKVNLTSIEDAAYVEKITKEIYEIKAVAEKEKERIMGIVNAAL